MPYIKGEDRNQIQIVTECLDEYVSKDNPVRVIDKFVDSLDLKRMGFTKSEPKRVGAPAYDPKDLLKLYLYGYSNGIRSSRKLEKLTHTNIEVMWLIRKLKPDFKTIADFRKENRGQVKEVFKEFIILCREWELIGKELIAVDGTKFRANNSRKNNYNKKKIERNLKRIEDRIDKFLRQIEENDNNENGVKERRYSEKEIEEKIKELEERRKFYEKLGEELEKSKDNEISATDHDARMMGNKKME